MWCVDCGCSSSHDVPFNQRLLSSTPSATPRSKRLVERQGVLLLNGSTETQVLNSTDAAAAVQVQSSPSRPPGPCLCRGDVQFAAAAPPRHCPSSSSSARSRHGSDVDVAVTSPRPLYSSAAGHRAPQTRATAPCYTIPSTALSTSRPALCSTSGDPCRGRTTSLTPDCQSGVPPAAVASSPVHSVPAGLYGTSVPIHSGLYGTSVAFTAPSTALHHIPQTVRTSHIPLGTSHTPLGTSRTPVGMSHIPVGMSQSPVGTSHIPVGMSHIPVGMSQSPVGMSQIPVHVTVPCSCTEPTLSTSTEVLRTGHHESRPPVTVSSSSSQDTIEIHLDSSPRTSQPQDQWRGAGGVDRRLPRRRPQRGTVRGRLTSSERRPVSRCYRAVSRCDRGASRCDRSMAGEMRRAVSRCDRSMTGDRGETSDTERLRSLLRTLKVVVAGNHDTEVSRLLTELCDMTAAVSSSQTAVKTTVTDSVDHSEITQLHRLHNLCVY